MACGIYILCSCGSTLKLQKARCHVEIDKKLWSPINCCQNVYYFMTLSQLFMFLIEDHTRTTSWFIPHTFPHFFSANGPLLFTSWFSREINFFFTHWNCATWFSQIRRSFRSKKKDASCKEGHAVAHLVDALCYKPEGRGFDSRWCHWNFSLT